MESIRLTGLRGFTGGGCLGKCTLRYAARRGSMSQLRGSRVTRLSLSEGDACAAVEPAATVEEADIEALLRQAEAADAAARATLTTPEEERAIIEAAETLAGSEAGVPPKSRAVVLRLDSGEQMGGLFGAARPRVWLGRERRADDGDGKALRETNTYS